ncbi:hypothetical protein [Nocardia sp. NBC_01388]|uniref:hypothetical protein n=1 Tax=Nocardia sp. NBC_01388 TaxID=2903596 RepID=UPI002F916DA3
MTTADSQTLPRLHDYEVLGRVLSVLCSTPGPLAECLGFRLWPRLHKDGGYVLSWHGHPSMHEVTDYLCAAAADDEMTADLRPGDIQLHRERTAVIVRGVQFNLQPEPMPSPESYLALGEFWRTGALPRKTIDS